MTENGEKITVPVGQALQALQILQRWVAAPFPAREAYRIGRVVARLQLHPDVVAAEQARSAAVRKFGVEKDGQITVPADNLKDFVAEYDPVAMTPVELDIRRLPASILDNAPNTTPGEMIALESFLEDD